jgi:two-component system, chemotaxis family, response regulator PixG
MTTDKNVPLIPISEFVASKQAGLFQTLKQPRFTGQLILTGPKGDQWTFYLYLGRIMYATGGSHPVRRWRRNLALYMNQIPFDLKNIQKDLENIPNKDLIHTCWEYQLLCLWVEQQKISREQVAKMIRAVITEIFFDVTQAVQITYQIKRDNNLSTQLVLIDADQVIVESWKLWQAWQSAKVADRSPNSAPVIKLPEQLQSRTPPKTYQVLSKLLDGQRTLRDLAITMRKNIVEITRSLMPYVQAGLVELVDLPDLQAPLIQDFSSQDQTQNPVIACIDDSPVICQTMEKIVTGAGYQFIGINDALRAIAVVLSNKPDLIFLDLIMPNANGYEICGQLRKLNFFKNTPIVILTGNDGIIDRVRSKMVGATDFLTKPVDQELVLETIRKYLRQKAND